MTTIVSPILVGLIACQAESTTQARLERLREIPGISSIVAAGPQDARRTIVHILNWHHVPKDAYAADLRDASETPLSDDEIDRQYAAFLKEVEALQDEQARLLPVLVKEMGVRRIYVEGVAPDDMPHLRRRIAALRQFAKNKPRGETPIEQLLLAEYRDDLLRIGAAGRLMIEGLVEIAPVEDPRLLAAADPLRTGRFVIDSCLNERRENAIVKAVLQNGAGVSIVVLGGAHDLGDNVPKDCRYLRVTISKYPVE